MIYCSAATVKQARERERETEREGMAESVLDLDIADHSEIAFLKVSRPPAFSHKFARVSSECV